MPRPTAPRPPADGGALARFRRGEGRPPAARETPAVRVLRDDDEALVVEARWWGLLGWLYAGAAVLWWTIPVVLGLSWEGATEMGRALWPAAGFALTYVAVAGVVNRVRLRMDGAWLAARIGPLPWPSGGAVSADAVERVRVDVATSRDGVTVRRTPRLVADLAGTDRAHVLVGRVGDRDAAEALALAVNRRIARGRAVPG